MITNRGGRGGRCDGIWLFVCKVFFVHADLYSRRVDSGCGNCKSALSAAPADVLHAGLFCRRSGYNDCIDYNGCSGCYYCSGCRANNVCHHDHSAGIFAVNYSNFSRSGRCFYSGIVCLVHSLLRPEDSNKKRLRQSPNLIF